MSKHRLNLVSLRRHLPIHSIQNLEIKKRSLSGGDRTLRLPILIA